MGGSKREFTGRLLVRSPYEFPPVMCINYVIMVSLTVAVVEVSP